MSSRVSNNDVHIKGSHEKQRPFLKSNDLQCPTCKKCLCSANHDKCVLKYLSELNSRASTQNKDAKSHKTTKRYMPVEKTSESKKPERQIPTGHRWVPTGKLFNSCTDKVDIEPTHGSNVDIPHIHACKQPLDLSAGTSFNGQKQQRIDLSAGALYNVKKENLRVWVLKMLISKKPVPECSDLAPQRQEMSAKNNTSGPVPQCNDVCSQQFKPQSSVSMTSDHNRSELEIHDHSNESSSSKLVPKVVPPADKTATSRQELELLFHHLIAMLRTTYILLVFTMKMEILLESTSNKLSVGDLRDSI
ncbi:hypothetical protein Tco_1318541 [Tanacetum coccineum]